MVLSTCQNWNVLRLLRPAACIPGFRGGKTGSTAILCPNGCGRQGSADDCKTSARVVAKQPSRLVAADDLRLLGSGQRCYRAIVILIVRLL